MKERISIDILQLFSGAEAWEYRLVPFEAGEREICCYGEEGKDYGEAEREICVLLGKRIRVERVSAEALDEALRRHYRDEKLAGDTGALFAGPEDPNFLDRLIGNAFESAASDIHFEPYEERCRVRFRIDGKLIERAGIDKSDYMALVNQIKIRANLDISEKRLPQDGRIFYRGTGQKFDVRVSCLPVIHGEKVVLRLLTRQVELLDIARLGFDEKQLTAYLSAVRRPNGLVLITGPTGSGKSTTLYATLRLLNEEATNLLTIEDPVEYTLEGVNQVQLKEEIGLTFAEALRTFLRQDPDIIMLGEIRDAETARMAVRSALTGHLLLSTIHTNSAWGSVARLSDMGVHPYLIADTLVLCVAQRLVRLLCPHCKKKQKGFSALAPEFSQGGGMYYRATGCPACYYTGYRGRKAVYEVVPADDELSALIRQGGGDITDYLKERGIRTLKEAARELVEKGETSPEEIVPLLAD